MAANAVSFGGEDGLSFVGQEPPVARRVALSRRYRVDRLLADGALFLPTTMEHKWALFFHESRLIFVRSWRRQVLVTACVHASGDGFIEVTEADGVFTDETEDVAFTSATIDFIVRTHGVGEVFPAPLLSDPGEDLRSGAAAAFNSFGKMAHVATHHRFVADPPEHPLRSHSLFHIAVAKGDVDAAQAELDKGVPIDLLAGDGLTALHWAQDTGVSSWLLARGLPVDARSTEGATVLMNAVQADDEQHARWLLDHGADPNLADNRGFTGLHRAAEMGLVSIARLLLEHGASATPIAQGYTPLALAQARGHQAVVALLGGSS